MVHRVMNARKMLGGHEIFRSPLMKTLDRVLKRWVMSCTILTQLFNTVLYCTVLCCAVLCCAVLQLQLRSAIFKLNYVCHFPWLCRIEIEIEITLKPFWVFISLPLFNHRFILLSNPITRRKQQSIHNRYYGAHNLRLSSPQHSKNSIHP